MSGIVFTEIDHNYVNPATNNYIKPVDSIFSNPNIWTKQGSGSNFYLSPVGVFNEYMTWAVFCLYVKDRYDKATANLVIEERESLMVEKRNFVKFKAFDEALLKLKQEHRELRVVDLYPYILE